MKESHECADKKTKKKKKNKKATKTSKELVKCSERLEIHA